MTPKDPNKPAGTGDRIPPPKDHRISVKAAAQLTKRYRKAAPASEHGGLFHADQVRSLLAQKGVEYLRYYHGLDAKGNYRIVLVGVDKDGNDIVKAPQPKPPRGKKVEMAQAKVKGGQQMMLMMSTGGADALLLEEHHSCPPYCSPNSPLF